MKPMNASPRAAGRRRFFGKLLAPLGACFGLGTASDRAKPSSAGAGNSSYVPPRSEVPPSPKPLPVAPKALPADDGPVPCPASPSSAPESSVGPALAAVGPAEAAAPELPLAPAPAAPSNLCVMHAEELEWGACLGGGGFGDVFAATHLPSGAALAVKCLRGEADAAAYLREATLTSGLAHQNVVPISGLVHGVDGGLLGFAMPVAQSSLKALITRQGHLFTEQQRVGLLLQLVEAVRHVHSQGIIHHDIKLDNILVYDDGAGGLRLALSDFGQAKECAAGETVLAGVCDLDIAAPEVHYGAASQASDMWSLGCVATQIWSLNARIYPNDVLGWQAKREKALQGWRPSVPAACPPPAAELLTGMLAEDPTLRPIAEDCLAVVQQKLLGAPAPAPAPPVGEPSSAGTSYGYGSAASPAGQVKGSIPCGCTPSPSEAWEGFQLEEEEEEEDPLGAGNPMTSAHTQHEDKAAGYWSAKFLASLKGERERGE